MKNETARREIESLDYYLQNHTDDYSEESHTAMMMAVKVLNQEPCEPILDKIRAEIKTKYDSIPWRNNDYDDGWIEALEWVFDDVLDKYMTESEKK